MSVSFSARIAVVNGFVIDKVDRKVISRSVAKNFLSRDKYAKLCQEYIRDKKILGEMPGQLLELDKDSELFQFVDCKRYKFNVMSDNTYEEESSRVSKRNGGKIRSGVGRLCHKYMFSGKRAIYICGRASSFTSDVDMLDFDPNLRKVKDTSVLVRIFKADEFQFSAGDFEALKEYTPEDATRYQTLGEKLLVESYDAAAANAANYVGPDFHTGSSSLIKRYDPATKKVYGRRLAPMLFVLFNGRALSPFASDEVPWDIELCSDIDRVDETIRFLGEMFKGALLENRGREFLVRWLRMSAIDHVGWVKYEDSFPLKQARTVRQMLDAVRCLIKFTAFSVSTEGLEEAVKTDDDQRFFKVFRIFYSAVVKQEKTIASTHVNIDPERGRVLVRNKVLSFDLLASMKEELHNTFTHCVGMLGRWVTYGSVAMVYNNTMGNPMVRIPDESVMDSRHASLFQSLPADLFNGYHMNWVRDEDAGSSEVAQSMLDIINRLTKVLMVCVWLSPGLPLRFPELSIITFAGEGRNVYIDVVDRIFFIKSSYNKNRKYENRLLFLDKIVSADLLWFIHILRPFVVKLLRNRLGEFQSSMIVNQLSREIETELVDEDAENNEDEDEELFSRTERLSNAVRNFPSLGNAVLKMFVFVDVKNMRLVDSNAFTKILATYPQNGSEAHKISSMRQGLAALWKHLILPKLVSVEELKIPVALGFGHSVRTQDQQYGMRPTESTELDYYLIKKLAQIFHDLTRYGAVTQDKKRRREDDQEYSSVGDVYDLVDAGKALYGDPGFTFRSHDQREFASMVLQSDKRLLTLQATTAFGKSLTFMLPMMVLKKTRPGRYVHFVGVPYESLKLATMAKLERAGLTARDIQVVHHESYKMYLHDTDVLVGCFDAFGANNLSGLLKNWDTVFAGEVQPGYLVFDEVHVLWTEKTFRVSFRQIRDLPWHMFLKMVFLSATVPEDVLHTIVSDRGIPRRLLEQSSRYVNAVAAVPNQHIPVICESVRRYDIVKHVVRSYVRRYVSREDRGGKAIFFFSSIKRMTETYECFKGSEEVAMVSSVTPEGEKQRVFEQFENPASRTKVIFGTKLISNGLDCSSVNLVILADCRANAVDYLQMVGRIRHVGVVRVVVSSRYGMVSGNDEVAQRIADIDWERCITDQVAEFYGIPSPGHLLCCGYDPAVDTEEIRRIRGLLTYSDGDSQLVTVEQDEGDGGEPLLRIIRDGRTGVLCRDFRELFAMDMNITCSLRDFFLNMDYAAIVRVFYDPPPNCCPSCYAPRDYCRCSTATGRCIGDLVSQLLILCKLEGGAVFARMSEELSVKGGYLFLLDELQELDGIWLRFNRMTIKLAKNVRPMVVPSEVGSDPETRFQRYWAKFLEQKVNLLHLVFGHRVVEEAALYEDMSGYVVKTFGNTDVVSEYSKYYDSGKFTTGQQDMVKIVSGWAKNGSEEGELSGDELAVVVVLLWCLFQEKEALGRMFAKFKIRKVHVLTFFPLFADMCFDKVKYGDKYVRLYVVILDSWLGEQRFVNV